MYVENANFIRSVEVDDSVFQCDPQCSKSYILKLQWDTDNAQRLWKVTEYAGEGWASSMEDLTDVSIGTVTDGQVLAYDAATHKWINKVDEWSDTFAGLTDVDITGLQNGDVAVYNSTTNKREPQHISADAVLSESITTNIAVGWIPAGTTLAAGTSIESIIRQMLVTYITPTLSLAAKSGVSLVNYVGDTVANPQFDVTAVRGSGTFTTVQLLAWSTLSDTQSMTGTTATLTYTGNVTTDTTFKAYVEDNGQTINSNTVTIKFVQGSYFGQVAEDVTNPTAADITGLTKLKNTAKGYTANNISMTYGKLLYAYPASYGDLTSIKDANNFEYITSYTKSTVSVNGVSYNCYLMTDATGVTGFKQIYA